MQEIQMVLDSYLATRAAGDADAWLSNWDEDGVALLPGARASSKDILREVTPVRFNDIPVNSPTIDTADITVIGEFAFAHGHFTLVRVVDGAPVKVDGKFLTVFKKQANGTWKIYRDCSNSNDH